MDATATAHQNKRAAHSHYSAGHVTAAANTPRRAAAPLSSASATATHQMSAKIWMSSMMMHSTAACVRARQQAGR